LEFLDNEDGEAKIKFKMILKNNSILDVYTYLIRKINNKIIKANKINKIKKLMMVMKKIKKKKLNKKIKKRMMKKLIIYLLFKV